MNKFIVLVYDGAGRIFSKWDFYDRKDADEFAEKFLEKKLGYRVFVYGRLVEYS